MDALKKAQEAKTKAQDGGEGDTAVLEAPSDSVTAAIDDAEFESLLEKKQPAQSDADIVGGSVEGPASAVALEPATATNALEFSLALEDAPGASSEEGAVAERSVVKTYAPKDDLGLKLDESETPLAPQPVPGLSAAICDDVLSELEKDLAKAPAAEAPPTPKTEPAPRAEPAAKAAAPAPAPVAPTPAKTAEKAADKPAPAAQPAPAQAAKEHPRKAARILSATGKTSRKSTWIRTALLGGGTLLLVAGVGGAYFYNEYQKLMAPTSQMPRPLPRPALSTAEPLPEEDVESAESGTSDDGNSFVAVEDNATLTVATAPRTPAAHVAPEAMPAEARPAPTEPKPAPVASAPAVKAVDPKPAPQEPTRVATQAPAPAAPVSARPPVSVKREEPKEDVVFRELSAAYSAYQSGDFTRASSAYRNALQAIPENRDALLGLAAISQKQGRPDEARALYQRVLHQNKYDSVAMAGWYGTMGEGDPLAMESELKVLLAREGNVAYLQFALGNAYARQQKWSLAEQAFNTALTLEPGNADYAYNLAVTHDQLGRRVEAARHYELALTLDRGNAAFDRDQVSRRLQQLRTTP